MGKNKVYLLGKANVGKSALFNELTDSRVKVANYHGVTTTLNKSSFKKNSALTLYDLPGAYSLTGDSKDEQLTIETLKSADSSSIWLFVLDAVDFKNNFDCILNFLNHFKEKKAKVLFVLNMLDELKQNQLEIEEEKLSHELNVDFISVSAKKKMNLEALENKILELHKKSEQSLFPLLEKAQKIKSDDFIKGDRKQVYRRMYQIDRFLLSPLWGSLFFIFSMLLVFQSVFTWATPFMDFIENSLIQLSELSSTLFSPDQIYLKSFVQDALFGGLGAFLVFTPQIFILSFLIKILEESGYLSRASLICHKALSLFGLSGESFIPLLTSHACAIPGIYASRHIKSKTVRFITLLSLPLTVCSARLPVYALLITVLVPSNMILGGLIGIRGLLLFSLYLFGILMSLIVSLLIRKSFIKSKKQSLLAIELPRYQIPSLKKALTEALKTSYSFIKDAGFIIFATNCVIWFLATFPKGPQHLEDSFLSQLGKTLHFFFMPLGFNWPETVAILTSFLARETFVSTLGTLYSVDSENVLTLAELIQKNHSQGAASLASTISLLVFFAIALQCVSTVALLRKELPKKQLASYLFFAYFFLAYGLSFIAYRFSLLFLA